MLGREAVLLSVEVWCVITVDNRVTMRSTAQRSCASGAGSLGIERTIVRTVTLSVISVGGKGILLDIVGTRETSTGQLQGPWGDL